MSWVVGVTAAYILSAILISRLAWGAVASQAIAGLVAFTLAARLLVGKQRLRVPPEYVLLGVFGLFSLIHVFWARDVGAYLTAEVRTAELLALGVVVYNVARLKKGNAGILAKWFVIGAILAGGLALVGVDYSGSSRVAGTLVNPNLYGVTLLLGLGFIPYLAAEGRTSMLWVWALAGVFLGYQIPASGSRKAILGLLVYAVLLLFQWAYRAFLRRPGRVMAVALGGVLVVAMIWSGSQLTSVAPRIENLLAAAQGAELEELPEGSLRQRASLYSAALATWIDHPLGVGNYQFRFYTQDYVEDAGETYAHSNYAELLADFGLIGTAFYYGAFFLLGRRLWRLLRAPLAPNGRFVAQVLASLLLLLLILDVGWVSYSDKTLWMAFGLMLAMTAELEDEVGGRGVEHAEVG